MNPSINNQNTQSINNQQTQPQETSEKTSTVMSGRIFSANPTDKTDNPVFSNLCERINKCTMTHKLLTKIEAHIGETTQTPQFEATSAEDFQKTVDPNNNGFDSFDDFLKTVKEFDGEDVKSAQDFKFDSPPTLNDISLQQQQRFMQNLQRTKNTNTPNFEDENLKKLIDDTKAKLEVINKDLSTIDSKDFKTQKEAPIKALEASKAIKEARITELKDGIKKKGILARIEHAFARVFGKSTSINEIIQLNKDIDQQSSQIKELRDQVGNELKVGKKALLDKKEELEKTLIGLGLQVCRSEPMRNINKLQMESNSRLALNSCGLEGNLKEDYALKEVRDILTNAIPPTPLTSCKITPTSSEIQELGPQSQDIGGLVAANGKIDENYGNKLTTAATADGKISAAVQSGYPRNSNGVQDGQPTADHAAFATFKTDDGGEVYIYSGADGCNWGQKPAKAARMANDSFIREATKELANKGASNLQELGQIVMNADGAASEAVKSLKDQGGDTTHVGIIAKKDPETGKTSGVITSVGDMKVFLRKKDGSIIEVTKSNRGNATDATDSGGRLKGSGIDGKDDLRNFSVFTFECEEGDVLLPLSDGVHDNLTPSQLTNNDGSHLYPTPNDALKALQDAGVKDLPDTADLPSDWKTENEALSKLTDIFMSHKLGEVLNNRGDKPMNEALVEHALNNTEPYRNWMEANPNKRIIDSIYGKPDHISCGILHF